MDTAIAAPLALVATGAVVALWATEPGAATPISGGINRQHGRPPGLEALQRPPDRRKSAAVRHPGPSGSGRGRQWLTSHLEIEVGHTRPAENCWSWLDAGAIRGGVRVHHWGGAAPLPKPHVDCPSLGLGESSVGRRRKRCARIVSASIPSMSARHGLLNSHIWQCGANVG